MANFQIRVDLGDVTAKVRGIIDAEVFPRLHQAVGAVAQQATIDWKEAVVRAKLWRGEKVQYSESIAWKMTGPFSAEVSSDYRYADEIDNGRPPRDLKRMLDTSLKVRTTKTGKRYLIIPFRHQIPGADAIGQSMPQDVYDLARQLAPSRVVGRTRRLSGTEAVSIKSRQPLTVAARKYVWGDSLKAGSAPGMQRRHEGMYKFDVSSGKSKSSNYITFRIMSESSNGWIIPARTGLYIVKGITARLQPLAEIAFSEAVKRDLA